VLVCIDHRSDANVGMRESGLFGVSVLGEEQEDVSRRFASRERDKLAGFAFVEGRHGLPLVPGAVAHVQCRVRSFHVEGDHTVWVGDVLALAEHAGRPLLYHAGAYHRLPGPE
jgi:flavin reductase (DIM6/NTAB) family NADH-FMN oxidoreductase RutF